MFPHFGYFPASLQVKLEERSGSETLVPGNEGHDMYVGVGMCGAQDFSPYYLRSNDFAFTKFTILSLLQNKFASFTLLKFIFNHGGTDMKRTSLEIELRSPICNKVLIKFDHFDKFLMFQSKL